MQLKALVVDDYRIVRNMMIRALERSGLAKFHFLEAADGAAALAVFEREPVDIALIDWNMPLLTGVEVVRQVRAKGNEHIPLVIVTAERVTDKVDEILREAGADAYLAKPFTDEELVDKVRCLVEGVIARKTRLRQATRGGWLARVFH